MRLNIFNRRPKESSLPIFDEAFLRRLERLNFRTIPSLRGTKIGERRSRNLRPALDFSDHRPYTAGDDLRHVDWNAFARQEALFVKLGEATQSVNLHILLDRSRSMSWASSPDAKSSKWAATRRLAGALGYLGLAGGERVRLTSFVHTLDETFGPTEGKRQVIPALQYLTALAPPSAPTKGGHAEAGGLSHSLTTYARNHPAGGLLVIISDLFDTVDAAFDASPDLEGTGSRWLAEGLRHLTPPRWQVLVVHLLTEEEVRPSLEGDLDLQDTETRESLPFHLDEQTLAQYRLRVRRWCANLQSICAQRRATYARVLAEWPLEQAVVPYLRQRGAIQ